MRQPGGGWYLPFALREVRETMGMTKLDLERASGVARGTILYLENGDRMARAKTLKKLADGLGVEPQDLIVPPRGARGADDD